MNGELGGNRDAQSLFPLFERKANGGKRFSRQLQSVSAMAKSGEDTKLQNLGAQPLKSDGPELKSRLCHQSNCASLEIHVTPGFFDMAQN